MVGEAPTASRLVGTGSAGIADRLVGTGSAGIADRLVGNTAERTLGAPSLRAEPTLGAPRGVWHREYWDRFIRDGTHFRSAVEYIVRNPVSAGLVRRPEDWPWCQTTPPGAIEGSP